MTELSEAKQQARTTWAAGDYADVAVRLESAGEKAVAAAEVKAGDSVLDVACGSGNATIPAARLGAETTGLDLTPELLEQGRAAAAGAGVEIEWVEGDAEQLPFEDGSFDVVISVLGSMFAPDHRAAAGEIARVLKPGGRMAVISWTPGGAIGQFFATVASQMPPPPEGFQPPPLWGTEDHVRSIFDDTGVELSFELGAVEFEFDSAEAWMDEFETKFGPVIMAKAALEPEGKWQPLRKKLIELDESLNQSTSGRLEIAAEYLLATGRKG